MKVQWHVRLYQCSLSDVFLLNQIIYALLDRGDDFNAIRRVGHRVTAR